MLRSMTTPPVVSMQQQINPALLMSGMGMGMSMSMPGVTTGSTSQGSSSAKYQQRQRPASTAPPAATPTAAMRKSPPLTPNVTVTPNMTFSPNMALQPGAQRLYNMNTVNMFNGYRMQQPMMNASYLQAGFLAAQPTMPMQMAGMMNVHPQQFQQQMQQHPGQPNVYPSYGYNLMNMNMNMRR
jgi:hypothetical protein